MSNVHPIFQHLFDNYSELGVLPKRQDDYETEPAIAPDIPKPVDPVSEPVVAMCKHRHTTARYDHVSCMDCFSVLTDSGWGIAKRRWFRDLGEARFFKANGRLPDREPVDPVSVEESHDE